MGLKIKKLTSLNYTYFEEIGKMNFTNRKSQLRTNNWFRTFYLVVFKWFKGKTIFAVSKPILIRFKRKSTKLNVNCCITMAKKIHVWIRALRTADGSSWKPIQIYPPFTSLSKLGLWAVSEPSLIGEPLFPSLLVKFIKSEC